MNQEPNNEPGFIVQVCIGFGQRIGESDYSQIDVVGTPLDKIAKEWK